MSIAERHVYALDYYRRVSVKQQQAGDQQEGTDATGTTPPSTSSDSSSTTLFSVLPRTFSNPTRVRPGSYARIATADNAPCFAVCARCVGDAPRDHHHVPLD